MLRKPNYFLLGAPKCATTAIASYLSDHREIYVSKIKEPHYFCKDLKAGGLPVQSDNEYLEKFFPGLAESGVKAAIDCSVWYLFSKVAVEEILRFEPEAKFIVMIRNPVKMVWSLYSMLSFQGQEDQKEFMKAWSLQDERRRGKRIPTGLWLDNRMLLYQDVCALGSQLKRLSSIIDKDRIHVEIQDDLKNNPREMYCRILNFMNVSDDGRMEFSRKNSGRKIKSALVYEILRSSIVKKGAVTAKKALGLKTLGFGRPDRRIPKDIELFLCQQFKNEVKLLEDLCNRKFDHWIIR